MIQALVNAMKWLGFGFICGFCVYWGPHIAISIVAGVTLLLFAPNIMNAKLTDPLIPTNHKEEQTTCEK